MATKQSIWRRWFCMTSLHPETWTGIRVSKGSCVTATLYLVFHFYLGGLVSHRIIPKSSKYPPRPWVPKGSLKVRTTQATLFLFHMGPNMRFPNLNTNNTGERNWRIMSPFKLQKSPLWLSLEMCVRDVTWAPWGSGPSLCPGSGLCGRSAPPWIGKTDELTAPVSSGGHGQRASQRWSCSSLCFTNTADQIETIGQQANHLFGGLSTIPDTDLWFMQWVLMFALTSWYTVGGRAR